MPIRCWFCLIIKKMYLFSELFSYLCKDKKLYHGGKEGIIYKSRNYPLCP
ncbi:unknown [Prevotella sp. CAG:1124]|nr:unknown [Prevotella sp. CAG:1124]